MQVIHSISQYTEVRSGHNKFKVPITTNVVSSNSAHGQVRHYVIKVCQ